MSDRTIECEAENSRGLNAFDSLVDIAIVFAVSAMTFFIEQWANSSGLISVPAAATGATAVFQKGSDPFGK